MLVGANLDSFPLAPGVLNVLGSLHTECLSLAAIALLGALGYVIFLRSYTSSTATLGNINTNKIKLKIL